MPAKDNQRTEELNEQEGVRPAEVQRVLHTLDQVFSTFRNQLRDDAPKPFDGAAKVAVDTFNDVVAGLKFKSLPNVLKISARAISPVEIELTWKDDTANADGYRILRCQGQYCHDFAEVRQLSSSVRSFRDLQLTGSTTYRYQVVSFNARGETPSNIVTITTAAGAPQA